MSQKIATCTYCGSRAALTLGGSERHELACGTCGAPLHDLKALKSKKSKTSRKSSKKPKVPPHRLEPAAGLPFTNVKYVKNRVTRKIQRKIAKKALGALVDLFD